MAVQVSFVRICASERGVFYARAHFELGKVVHVLDEVIFLPFKPCLEHSMHR